MGKIIVIDFNIFAFRATFAWRKNREIPMEYIFYNMLTSALTKIGVTPYTEIIIAIDGQGRNWRKDYEPEYKANRQEDRDKYEDVNWEEIWAKFKTLRNQLDEGTDWHIVQLDKIEADDIASVVCRKYKDKEIILVSYDKDWEMLLHYPNVKIFSILKKYKSKKGAYKVPSKRFSAYKLLTQKIKEEKTDNLVNPVLSERDYENRKMAVNLLELPEFIETQIEKELDNLKPKENTDIEAIPYQSIQKRINELYNSGDKIITYSDCVTYEEKKKKRKRRKKK